MKKTFKFLALAWMILIFSLSSLSGNDLNSLPAFSDILGHGILYFILALLYYFSFPRACGKLTVIAAALYGLSDEFHQSFVPGRTPELKDWVVDVTAALLAVLIIKFVKNKKGLS